MAEFDRIAIVGGPRCGKSWLAEELHAAMPARTPIHCGDPLSMVKEPRRGVHYLPEGLAMEDESTCWIVDNWFEMPGPWICEGWIMARALRKWMQIARDDANDYGMQTDVDRYPCDRVIVFREQRPELILKRGQVSMHKAVQTVWREIAEYFEPITEYR